MPRNVDRRVSLLIRTDETGRLCAEECPQRSRDTPMRRCRRFGDLAIVVAPGEGIRLVLRHHECLANEVVTCADCRHLGPLDWCVKVGFSPVALGKDFACNRGERKE